MISCELPVLRAMARPRRTATPFVRWLETARPPVWTFQPVGVGETVNFRRAAMVPPFAERWFPLMAAYLEGSKRRATHRFRLPCRRGGGLGLGRRNVNTFAQPAFGAAEPSLSLSPPV